MAGYVERNLGKDEKVLVQAKKNWLSVVGDVVSLVVSLVVLIPMLSMLKMFGGLGAMGIMFKVLIPITYIISIIAVLKKVLDLVCLELVITNKRVIGKAGCFSVEAIDFPIERVDNISYKATFWGKIFHFYKVEVGGGGTAKKKLNGISNAEELKNGLHKAVEMHAEEARKAQAREMAAAMASAGLNPNMMNGYNPYTGNQNINNGNGGGAL